MICRISPKPAAFDVVVEHRLHCPEDLGPVLGAFDREHQLHALVQVSHHPVGARQIDLLLAAIQKTVDARVFEKTVDDRYDFDAGTQTGDPWPERADAPDIEPDLHA